MDKKEVIKAIEDLQISYDEFWVLASSALVLRNLWNAANDLDIAVTAKGLDELQSKYNLIQKENGWYIVNNKVECVLSNKNDYKIDKIGNYNIQCLEDYYDYLKTTRKDKDEEKYKVVKKALKINND